MPKTKIKMRKKNRTRKQTDRQTLIPELEPILLIPETRRRSFYDTLTRSESPKILEHPKNSTQPENPDPNPKCLVATSPGCCLILEVLVELIRVDGRNVTAAAWCFETTSIFCRQQSIAYHLDLDGLRQT